jgi:hypothetical protein
MSWHRLIVMGVTIMLKLLDPVDHTNIHYITLFLYLFDLIDVLEIKLILCLTFNVYIICDYKTRLDSHL